MMKRKSNWLKLMCGTLVVAMAMLAVSAGQAAATTWTTEVTVTPGSEMEIGVQASGSTVLGATVSGLAIELTAKKVEAVAPTKIKQTGEGASGVATATGSLKYSELSLQKPVGCTAPASITTKALKAELVAVAALKSGEALKWRPLSATEPTLFATFTLGGECALAGTPFKVTIPKESYFCSEVEPLGTMLVQEPIRSSATINSNCGGKLEALGNAAALTGTVTAFSKPGGIASGEKWGAQ
jgi:hypothetical protein